MERNFSRTKKNNREGIRLSMAEELEEFLRIVKGELSEETKRLSDLYEFDFNCGVPMESRRYIYEKIN